MDGGDHHLGRAVDGQQGVAVNLEKAVAVGDEFDLALLRLSAVDVFARGSFIQQGGGFVLVEDAGLLLPDVEILFADGEQHGDVLGLDDMALAEAGTLELAGNDLGNIVAEHLPCRVFGADEFHCGFPPYSVGIWATSQSASACVSSRPKSASGMSPTTASGWKDTGVSEISRRTTSIFGQPLSLKPSKRTRS